MQKFVTDNGKHTSCVEQHELTMHTDVFDAQAYLILLHGFKIKHRIPGAHRTLFLSVR